MREANEYDMRFSLPSRLSSVLFFPLFPVQEQKRRFRRWVHCDSFRGVDLAYSKVGDGVPLRLWRGVVEVPAPPNAVLHRLWEERYVCSCASWADIS